ncbi:MAG: protein kinase domain-containing protein, partial [Terriglobales bacterium]
HRDLKPGNVILTTSGAKLLDFGLAKPAAMMAGAASGSAPLLSAAATMTAAHPSGSPLTSVGSIVGTIQYMAPEQLEGREADARTDIFALGSVLYEMATGRRPFTGKSQISVASAILESDPEPISARQPTAPAELEYVVRTCLAKEPDERFASAHDVKLQLQRVSLAPAQPTQAASGGRAGWIAAAAIMILAVATVAGLLLRSQGNAVPPIVGRFAIPFPTTAGALGFNPGIAISHDGRTVALVAAGAQSQLYVRVLDHSDYVEVPDSAHANNMPAFSPDGRWLAYVRAGNLMKWPLAGGSPVAVAGVGKVDGLVWTTDDEIIFGGTESGAAPTINAGHGLMAVSAAGGTPHSIMKMSVPGYLIPGCLLPDGKTLLYTLVTYPDAMHRIMALNMKTGQSTPVLDRASFPHYALGYLLYATRTADWAVRFDPATLKTNGDAVKLDDRVLRSGSDEPLSVSDNGVLAYIHGTAGDVPRNLLWIDRKGNEQIVPTPAQDYYDQAIAPDGRRFAVTFHDQQNQVVEVYDPSRGGMVRFQPAPGVVQGPTWTPDGKNLLFTFVSADPASRAAGYGIYRAPVDGTAPAHIVVPLASVGWTTSVDRSGDVVVMNADSNGWSISSFHDGPSAALKRVSYASASEGQPALSPDGHWIAFTSNEAGSDQIFVAAFPGPGIKIQVSTEGGNRPRWSGNGSELFYRSGNGFYAVPIKASPELSVGKPVLLFEKAVDIGGAIGNFDVAPDGQHFLVTRAVHAETPEVDISIGWQERLANKPQ